MSQTPFSPEEIASEGIKPEEYQEILNRLGRHPNKAELGMFGVMWSEHCCYKNSRPLLKQFPTTGKRILVGPGENAGVIDLDNGLKLAFKIESHNHPSAVEPFQVLPLESAVSSETFLQWVLDPLPYSTLYVSVP